ncbi:MAG: glycosyltransferase family 4 protein [Bacteroidales bacterium]|nr:glycosyltransferase family 4 protein [Bacteroidales bacterium]
MNSTILIVAAVFPPEPVVSASRSYELARELSRDYSVKVVTPRPSRPLGYVFKKHIEYENSFEQTILNSFVFPRSRLIGRLRESYSFGKHIADYIRKNRNEIGCVFVGAWPLFAQYFIVRASVKYSIPSVISVQDIYPESLLEKLPAFRKLVHRLLLPIDKYSLRNSTKVATISPNMKDYLVRTRGLEEQNIEVVHNWSQSEKFLKFNHTGKRNCRSKPFTFMFLGSLSPTAGVDTIIKSYCIGQINDSRLIIAGNGSERDSLMKLANSYTGSNIEFWDAQPEEVLTIQDQADVLLLSLRKGSAFYALPSKLCSYMLSEKPIIACVDQGSDSANIIKAAGCGWVIPPDNLDVLADTMQRTAKMTLKDLQDYGAHGYKFALHNFSREENLNRLVNIILDIRIQTKYITY